MIGKLLILPILMASAALVVGLVPWIVAEIIADLLFLAAGAIMVFGAIIALILVLEGAATRGRPH